MNLLFSTFFLLAGLILHSSAQTLDECRTLVEPLPKFELQLGRWNFIAGYVTSEPFLELFRSCQSQWIKFRTMETPGSFLEDIGIKHPHYCKYGTSQGFIFRNSGIIHKSNFSCTYHSMPTCEDCLLYHVNSVNNRNLVLMDNPISTQDVPNYQAFYLMSRGTQLNQLDLKHFVKQAHCLGFKGDPVFVYDTSDTYCDEVTLE